MGVNGKTLTAERRRWPRLPLAIPVFVRSQTESEQEFLEFADLHGEGRLADAASFGGTAKMPVLGHGQKVAKVPDVHWSVSLPL